MKRIIIISILIALISVNVSMAAETATVGDIVRFPDKPNTQEFTIPITIISDSGGGALAATNIPSNDLYGAKLDEVEVVHGTSTCSLTIKNIRGTVIFTTDSMSATTNQIYPGFSVWGFNPKMDTQWTIETGALAASDTIIVLLKFSKRK